jgi:hypothetical protein
MLSVVTTEQTTSELRLDLDAIVREGARRMLAAALEAEVDDYLVAYAAERDEVAGGWWCATATPASATSRPPLARWPSARRGLTTAGSTR